MFAPNRHSSGGVTVTRLRKQPSVTRATSERARSATFAHVAAGRRAASSAKDGGPRESGPHGRQPLAVNRLTIHHGRHTFVSHALAGGRTLAEVRDAAGHTNVSVTSAYLHIAVDGLRSGNTVRLSWLYIGTACSRAPWEDTEQSARGVMQCEPFCIKLQHATLIDSSVPRCSGVAINRTAVQLWSAVKVLALLQ
jgi:hypothetical protein